MADFEQICKMKNKNFLLIQIGLWLIVYLMLLIYFSQKNEVSTGIATATIFVCFYSITVYTNANWLIIRYFKQNQILKYTLFSVGLLLIVVIVRMFVEGFFLNHFFLKHAFYGWNLAHFFFVLVTQFLAFLFGFLLRISIDYVELLRKQEMLKNQQLTSELNLLKAQVQPHFLFNTLNNIYSLAVAKSDRTPETIAKLSEIMRYFVDEAPKEKVSLETELSFLKSYIELEQIRMVYPLKLSFKNEVNSQVFIPPMLFTPIVENIFKHGIDKIRNDNFADMSIKLERDYLIFESINRVCEPSTKKGFGLENLQKRLQLLFSDDYELTIQIADNQFVVVLEFKILNF